MNDKKTYNIENWPKTIKQNHSFETNHMRTKKKIHTNEFEHFSIHLIMPNKETTQIDEWRLCYALSDCFAIDKKFDTELKASSLSDHLMQNSENMDERKKNLKSKHKNTRISPLLWLLWMFLWHRHEYFPHFVWLLAFFLQPVTERNERSMSNGSESEKEEQRKMNL